MKRNLLSAASLPKCPQWSQLERFEPKSGKLPLGFLHRHNHLRQTLSSSDYKQGAGTQVEQGLNQHLYGMLALQAEHLPIMPLDDDFNHRYERVTA